MSTDQQDDSPVTQGQQIEVFLRANPADETWSRSYFDLGISGKSLAARPGMVAMLTDAENLRPSAVVFYKLDRAFRNSYEQSAALRRLKKLGIRILKVKDPNIDGPQGDLIDTVLGAVNQFERELTGVRIRDHNQSMASRGEWPGGVTPFGYRYRKAVKSTGNQKATTLQPGGLEPDPIEWPIARQFWDWALEGHRPGRILDMARDAGYLRRHGKPWTFPALTRLFGSRVYAGYVPFGHHSPGGVGEWYMGQHKAMVTQEERERVRSLLSPSAPKVRQRRQPRMELAGISKCGLCDAPLGSDGARQGDAYGYTCTAVMRKEATHVFWSRRSWMIHWAVESVIGAAIAAIPKAAKNKHDYREEQRIVIQQDIDRLHRQMSRLRELYVIGEFNDDLQSYQARRSAIEQQITDKKKSLTADGAGADELKARRHRLQNWHTAYAATTDVLERQRLWRAVVESVTCDGSKVVVVLVDLGPGVPRQWTLTLPPPGTRKPGTRHTSGGIVGVSPYRPSRSFMAANRTTPTPVR